MPEPGEDGVERSRLAVYLRHDGRTSRITPANGRTFSLRELQTLVGGYIEVVALPGQRHTFVIHEEGKLLDLPRNDAASLLWWTLDPRMMRDHLVGDVLLCPRAMLEEAEEGAHG